MPLGFLSTVLAKLGGAGAAAKAAIATVTACTTLTVAGAAAGVLPGPVQGAVGGAMNAVSPLNVPTSADGVDPAKAVEAATGAVDDVLASVPASIPGVPADLPVSAGANVKTPVGGAAAGASANVSVPSIPQVSVPGVPLPVVPIPDVGAIVGSLPVPLPACVANLLPTGGALPDPTALLAKIPACIQTILASTNLPANVPTCLASVLGTVAGVLNPAAIGSLPKLDLSTCVPLDVTQCTSSVLAATGAGNLPFVGDMLKQIFASSGLGAGAQVGGGLNGLFAALNLNVPGLNAIPAGCVPIDVSKCLTAVTGILGSIPAGGGMPKVNLSACMPTGLTAGIPGVGSGIPGLGGIPFFPFGG